MSGKDFDPATKSVKRNRVGNIGSDRLHARRNQLGKDVLLNPGQFNTRHNWVMRAAELSAIEGELVGRGELERGYSKSANPAAEPVHPPGDDPTL